MSCADRASMLHTGTAPTGSYNSKTKAKGKAQLLDLQVNSKWALSSLGS